MCALDATFGGVFLKVHQFAGSSFASHILYAEQDLYFNAADDERLLYHQVFKGEHISTGCLNVH